MLSLFTGDMILYTENSKKSTKVLLELINSARLQDIRSIYKSHLDFYILVMKNQELRFF